MIYRKLSAAGDYTFGQSGNDFLRDSSATVAQAVLTRLRLLQGEWFLNTDEGTPYNARVLGKNRKATADQAIRQRIAATPNVVSVDSYASQLQNRSLRVQALITTSFSAGQQKTSSIPLGDRLDYTFVLDTSLLI